jgi:hypothetical protein
MTMREPPKLATWLLSCLGCSADNDAVLGDIAERYLEGKSAYWYWKQILIAIAVGAVSDVRDHRMLVIRAAIAGMLVSAGIEASVTHYLPLVPYWIPVDWWASETLRTSFLIVVGSAVHIFLTLVCGWTIVWLFLRSRVSARS